MYVFATIAALSIAGFAWAQSEGEYQGWMKMNAATMGSLNKNIMAKNGEAAAADAQKLEGILKDVEAYWKEKDVPDAVSFAAKGQAAAAAVAKAAAAGDMDAAAMDVKGIQANCGGCHMAHREKTPEGFKMK